MRCINLFKSSLLIACGTLLAVSCKKVASPEPMGDKGQTRVKFIDGLADTANGYSSGYRVINIDLVNTPQVLELADIRRDAPNNAELNKTMKVVVQEDPGAATAYNPEFLPLPPGSYTLDPSITQVGSDYEFTFAPGEFSKNIKITLLNALDLDLNKKYAVAFRIVSADQGGKLATLESSLVVEIGVKNQWDGIYKVSGNFFHPTNAALVGPFGTSTSGGDLFCQMVTTGKFTLRRDYGGAVGESVIVYNSTAGGFTYFTGVKMRFAVDPATNLVDVSATPVTPPTPPFAARDASPYNCTYNPSTKTFNLNYGWTAAGGQRLITEVLQYVRPR